MRGEDMSSAESPSSGRLLSAYAAIYLIWGSTYLVIRFAIETIPPFLMSGSRYFVAGALLIAWTWAKGCPIPTFKQWRDGSIAGTLMLFMGTSAITWAEQWVPSSIAALLAAMVPVWLIVFSWVQTRPTWRVFTGLIVGFTGVGLLVANGRGYANEPLDVVGVAVTVGATLCWALGSLFSRRANKTDSAMMTVGIQMSCADPRRRNRISTFPGQRQLMACLDVSDDLRITHCFHLLCLAVAGVHTRTGFHLCVCQSADCGSARLYVGCGTVFAETPRIHRVDCGRGISHHLASGRSPQNHRDSTGRGNRMKQWPCP
jgi:hypothetical protein